jgi:hypothetical protein
MYKQADRWVGTKENKERIVIKVSIILQNKEMNAWK